jgi:hypothetical protein
MTIGPGAGLCVDESNAGGFEAGEFPPDVVGAVCDVVQSLTTTLEKAAYGRVRTERLEEFDIPDEGDADALGFQHLGRGTTFTGQEFIHDCALIERVHGDRNVVE